MGVGTCSNPRLSMGTLIRKSGGGYASTGGRGKVISAPEQSAQWLSSSAPQSGTTVSRSCGHCPPPGILPQRGTSFQNPTADIPDMLLSSHLDLQLDIDLEPQNQTTSDPFMSSAVTTAGNIEPDLTTLGEV